jgi:hypothetical protein
MEGYRMAKGTRARKTVVSRKGLRRPRVADVLLVDGGVSLDLDEAGHSIVEGFTIEQVSHGVDALERLSRGPLPRLLVVDLETAGSGDLLAAIDANPRYAQLRLMVTTQSPDSVLAEAFRLANIAVVPRPDRILSSLFAASRRRRAPGFESLTM